MSAVVRVDGTVTGEALWIERAKAWAPSQRSANTVADAMAVTFSLSRSCDRLHHVELLDAGRRRGSIGRGPQACASRESWDFSCEVFHKDDHDVVELVGELDVAGWAWLQQSLADITSRKVLIDISGLTFADLKGVSLLQEVENHLLERGYLVTFTGASQTGHQVRFVIALSHRDDLIRE